MAIGDYIQRHPLLRLFVPYACGICLADVAYLHVASLVLWGMCGVAVALTVLLLMWMWRRCVPYGVIVSVLFFTLGLCNYSWVRNDIEYEWKSEELLYEARVLAEPRSRQRSVLCEVEVTAVNDSSGWCRVGHKVMAYMEPCSEVEKLLPGDMLCFRGRVRAPHNFSDSLAFDYARYITMQGVSGTVYLPDKAWRRVGEDAGSLRERMLRLRHDLTERYMLTTFEGDALGVLSALSLGDKRGLNTEVRRLYSDVGASHVLALSGLHVGVLYGMVAFVLRGLFRKRGLRWLREVITILMLWLFVLLVGMSASVVRAVAMCTLYILARWVSDGTSSSLHVLSLTALLMLLVRPLYLFDVGFQLSFMAMAAILWLEPRLEMLFQRHALHPIPGYLVGLLCMSLAAQLGTFPLVLYHFGTFPVYFLLTNLLIVPALSVVLMLMLMWWALILTGLPLAQPLGTLLQWLVELLNNCLFHIGQWPGAVLHVVGYDASAVVFTYSFILFMGLFLVKKWSRGLIVALASFLGLLLSLLW